MLFCLPNFQLVMFCTFQPNTFLNSFSIPFFFQHSSIQILWLSQFYLWLLLMLILLIYIYKYVIIFNNLVGIIWFKFNCLMNTFNVVRFLIYFYPILFVTFLGYLCIPTTKPFGNLQSYTIVFIYTFVVSSLALIKIAFFPAYLPASITIKRPGFKLI